MRNTCKASMHLRMLCSGSCKKSVVSISANCKATAYVCCHVELYESSSTLIIVNFWSNRGTVKHIYSILGLSTEQIFCHDLV